MNKPQSATSACGRCPALSLSRCFGLCFGFSSNRLDGFRLPCTMDNECRCATPWRRTSAQHQCHSHHITPHNRKHVHKRQSSEVVLVRALSRSNNQGAVSDSAGRSGFTSQCKRSPASVHGDRTQLDARKREQDDHLTKLALLDPCSLRYVRIHVVDKHCVDRHDTRMPDSGGHNDLCMPQLEPRAHALDHTSLLTSFWMLRIVQTGTSRKAV